MSGLGVEGVDRSVSASDDEVEESVSDSSGMEGLMRPRNSEQWYVFDPPLNLRLYPAI